MIKIVIKNVIFDMGDTLFPKKEFVFKILIGKDFVENAAEWYTRNSGLSKGKAEEKVKQTLNRFYTKTHTIQDLVDAEAVNTEGALSGRYDVPLLPGARDTLEYIHSKGIKIATFSNGGTNSQKAQMAIVGFDKYISQYFSVANLGNKQESETYKCLCDKLGVLPENAMYFNDDHNEAKAADAAGIGSQILIGDKVDTVDSNRIILVKNHSQALEYLVKKL